MILVNNPSLYDGGVIILATSSVDRPNQRSKLIRSQYQCKVKEESLRFYQLKDRGLDRQATGTRRLVSPDGQVGGFFDAVTRLKSGLAEFSHPLD
jgi:hypothetical protein